MIYQYISSNKIKSKTASNRPNKRAVHGVYCRHIEHTAREGEGEDLGGELLLLGARKGEGDLGGELLRGKSLLYHW